MLAGFLLGAACVGFLWLGVSVRATAQRGPDTEVARISLEGSLWVCDWEMKKFYQPGSLEQRQVLAKLDSAELREMRFASPVLYRMGGNMSMDSREGLMLAPFDPGRPELARHLLQR